MSTKDNKKTNIFESVFKSFPYPEILENLPGIQNILQDPDITSADNIIEKYLIIQDLSNKISAEIFTEIILENPAFNSEELIIAAEKILKTSDALDETLNHLLSLSFRYIHNPDFRLFIDNAFHEGEEVNAFMEDDLVQELNRYNTAEQYIEFKGFPSLLPDCHLVSDIKEYLKLSKSMDTFYVYEDDFWHSLSIKESFLIYMEKPCSIIFKIEKNPYMQWFEINKVASFSGKEPETGLIFKMARQITEPENQLFFEQNYYDGIPRDDSHNSALEKNVKHFKAGRELLKEMKKTDKTLEVKELKIKDHENKEGLFQVNNFEVSEKTYNELRLSIKDMFVELETDHRYLLSKIESSELLKELIRRKSDNLYNYCLASLDKEFLKESNLKKAGDESDPSNIYEGIFKNFLFKLNMAELTKARPDAGAAAILTKINQQIQDKTTEEILEAIPDIDKIKKFLEANGCFVMKKEEQTGYTLFKFLCDKLGVSYFTEKSTLMDILRDHLKDPAF